MKNKIKEFMDKVKIEIPTIFDDNLIIEETKNYKSLKKEFDILYNDFIYYLDKIDSTGNSSLLSRKDFVECCNNLASLRFKFNKL